MKPEAIYNLIEYTYSKNCGTPAIVCAADDYNALRWKPESGMEVWEADANESEFIKRHFFCNRCKLIKTHDMKGSCSTGYASNRDHTEKTCFDCCAIVDREEMETSDKTWLYVTHDTTIERSQYTNVRRIANVMVSNWCGTLKIKPTNYRQGTKAVFGRLISKLDVWFKDHKGATWHGVQYGDNDQILRCKKLKASA